MACGSGHPSALIYLLLSYAPDLISVLVQPDEAITLRRSVTDPFYGLNALHIACANGHIGTAITLLDFQYERCINMEHVKDASAARSKPRKVFSLDINVRDKVNLYENLQTFLISDMLIHV